MIVRRICAVLLLLFLGGSAAADETTMTDAYAALEEGSTLDIVEVPAGFGDGRVTERDARAVSEYCVWGFNQVLVADGYDMTLDDGAVARMLEFWIYVWEHVDPETKAVISMADAIWPAIHDAHAVGDDVRRNALLAQFVEIMREIWGGMELPTVQYLAGQMAPADYVALIDSALAQAAAAETDSRSGVGGTSVDGLVHHVPDHESGTSYVMNDGSGDIMYSDP